MSVTIKAVETGAVVNRLKRAQGQLAGVLRMIEDERDLEAVLTQLKAVSRALDRAGLTMVVDEWRSRAPGGAGPDDADLDRFQSLFLSLR